MMKKENKIIVVAVMTIILIRFVILISLLVASAFLAKVEVNTDINKYNNYIGKNAQKEYKNKWDMDETIFPNTIKKNMEVEDYKMVYYNPCDAQYLSYVVINYNKNDYIREVERLKKYPSTKYKGYYGVTGFSEYTLLAIYADSYNGFVYAITDNKNKIIYVELIFCNYFYDIEYEQYINEKYLPDGFDAHHNNVYSKNMMKDYKKTGL